MENPPVTDGDQQGKDGDKPQSGEAETGQEEDAQMVEDLPPVSYRTNSDDEVELLKMADNFQRQYSHYCPERKPLFLCPVNECGIKKFVSTTLRPTMMDYSELYTWDGAASFVADYLTLEPLEPPDELPKYLCSPTLVLRRQKGMCFEFATLLCSLLLGANYDAYCVSGYAVKEMCQLNQTHQECPLLDPQVKVCAVQSEHRCQEFQYQVKPLKELKSRFVAEKNQRTKEAGEAARWEKIRQQENLEMKPPSPDPLRGLRLHSWVLVLAGSRSIMENFFIDPLTGKKYSTTDENFLGIESIWNNVNYYANMQDCSNGCADMTYDLDDISTWEPLLAARTTRDQNDEEKKPSGAFIMPGSWVDPLAIAKKDLETRWPGGSKVTFYKKAKLERFALEVNSCGLVTRLTTYSDMDCTNVVAVKEWYRFRDDHLEEREVNYVEHSTTESFGRGRRFHLLYHRYTTPPAEVEREMEFSTARVDGLVRRKESPGLMTETYEGREDFLYYRHVVYNGNFTDANIDLEELPLLKVVERFDRNRKKPAKEDVAERVFLVIEKRVNVTYHLEDHRFIPPNRRFIKPGEHQDFTADMVSSFQVDRCEIPPCPRKVYDMLLRLMKDEEVIVQQIKASITEIRNIVACREQENKDVELDFPMSTTKGASLIHSQREEMKRRAAEELRLLQEKKIDILAPFLARLSNPENLNEVIAQQLYEDCLAEFKERLVAQANLIQERYDRETEELHERQHWFHKNQLNMTKQQTEEYHDYCAEKTLKINVAKRRISLHQEASTQKYVEFVQKLKKDPRLAPYLRH
ncbi:dynein regulatory complex subunit 7 [Neosynchiropus ocellatus]